MGLANGFPSGSAWRDGAKPFQPRGGFQPPAPVKPPQAANDNLPRPANDNAPNAYARSAALTALRYIAPRFVPGLALGFLAYEFYEWYRRPGLDMTGWTNYCGSGGSISLAGFRGCGGLVFDFASAEGTVDPAGYMELVTLDTPNWLGIPNYNRYLVNSMWTATAGSPAPEEYPAQPLPDPAPDMPPYKPYEPPTWEPSEDPANDPVWEPRPLAPPFPGEPLDPGRGPPLPGTPRSPEVPRTTPWQVPWRVIPYSPALDNWLTQRGNKPQVLEEPAPLPNPLQELAETRPDIVAELNRRIRNQPFPRQHVRPSTLPKVSKLSPSVFRASRPTGPRRKEIKIKVVAPAIAKALINAATETCDAVGALFEAIPAKQRIRDKVTKKLPKNAQKDKKRPTQKWTNVGCPEQAAYVYRHLNDVKVNDAIKNLLVNELIDRSIGKINQKVNSAYVKANKGTRVGIGFGSTF